LSAGTLTYLKKIFFLFLPRKNILIFQKKYFYFKKKIIIIFQKKKIYFSEKRLFFCPENQRILVAMKVVAAVVRDLLLCIMHDLFLNNSWNISKSNLPTQKEKFPIKPSIFSHRREGKSYKLC
jgi:hypothetical protein